MIDKAYGHKDYTCLQKTRLRPQDIRHGADKRIATGGHRIDKACSHRTCNSVYRGKA